MVDGRRIYLLDKHFVTSQFCPLVIRWPFLRVEDQVAVETCFFSRAKTQGDVWAVVVVQHWCTKWTQKPCCHYYFIHSHIKLQTCTHTTLVLIYSKIAHAYYFFIFYLFLLWASSYTPPPITPPTPKYPPKVHHPRYSQHFEKPSKYSNLTNNIQNGKLICKKWTADYQLCNYEKFTAFKNGKVVIVHHSCVLYV